MSDVPTIDSIEQLVFAFSLATTRISSFIVAAPIFGRGTVPKTVKVGLCLSLSMFWLPIHIEQSATISDPSVGIFAIEILKEFIVGISLGYLVRLVFLPVRIAGSYVGQELGFNLGQVADPTTGSATNETGLVFDALGVVLFWAADLHHLVLRIVGLSFQFLEGDRDFLIGVGFGAEQLFSNMHERGVAMVAPLAAVLFLTLVALAVLMRAWPQITLFSFGIGARLWIGLVVFFLLLPQIVVNMSSIFHTALVAISDGLFTVH